MSAFTPGPWRAVGLELGNPGVMAADDYMVCDARVFNRRGRESEANARLIAAAPALLEALQAILRDDSTANRTLALSALKAAGAVS